MSSDLRPAAVMELRLTQADGDAYTADATIRLPQSAGDTDLIRGVGAIVRFDPEALLALRGDPERYGARLSEMLFAAPSVREALVKARSQAEALDARLRLVLRLDPTDPLLNGLAWETLADPAGGPLFIGERVLLSRYLESADMAPMQKRPQAALSALVAVASPADLGRYGLGPIDQRAEAARVCQALGSIEARVLSRERGAPPTLSQIAAALRDGTDILYLVCHGTSRSGQPLLWLEAEDGQSDRVSGEAFVRMVAGLERRPLLVVLASCESAGDGADLLAALGPRLVGAGVAAVLAMQGKLSAETAGLAMPAFFRELSRDGQIDRAAAVARAVAQGRPDWWLPVLFLRLWDGRIWTDPPAPPAQSAPAANTLAARNRARMLARVRDFWVHGVLEASSGRLAMIDLQIIRRHDALNDPWHGLVERPVERERERLPGRLIRTIFDEGHGELLILGRPGSGKTTLLLTLARALIERAEGDPTCPIPVVFNLASWHERFHSLDDWLIEELYTRYDVPRETGLGWVRERQLLPLLDGLDEVRAEERASCLEAINVFGRNEVLGELVVCSRTDEYERIGVRLRLQMAVELLPLNESTVAAYLDRGGEGLAQVRALYRRDPAFSALLETPLMLNVVSAAYGGDAHIPISISAGIWRKYIFGAYVRRMLERRGGSPRYPPEDVVRWLSVLARAMQVRSQSTFLIERMQPTWLQRPWDVLRYKLLVRVLSGLGLGTVSFSLIIPVSGWWPGLVGGLAGLLMWALGWGRLRPWVLSICYGLAVGAAELSALPQLSTGYLLGFIGLAIAITGMGAWIAARQSNFSHIDVIPSLRWSWAQGLWAGLLAGLIGGIPAVVLISLLTKSWPTAFSAGGALGIVIGSQAGLAVGMAARELETSSQPNDGVRRTLRSALRAVAVASPVFGLVGVLLGVALHTIAEPLRQWPFPGLTNPWLTGLSGLISGGMAAFIGFGGLVALQHLVLRLVLYRAGLAPWNIAAFLDYCAERVLLRKVGGGYIFIHRTLLEYFAEGPEL